MQHRTSKLAAIWLSGLLVAAGAGTSRAFQDAAPQPDTQASQPQRKQLNLDSIYGSKRVNLNGSVQSGHLWLDDGQHYLLRRGGSLKKIDAITDQAVPAYDVEKLEAALAAHPDFDEKAAKRLAGRPPRVSPDRRISLIEHKKKLYYYWFDRGELWQISDEPGEHRWLTHSPNLRYLSFVRDFDLYVIDTQQPDRTPRRLTQGGSEQIRNADLDWVYAEEVYGHRTRAYWWSDDERLLAYLQLDNTNVPRFTVVDYMPLHLTLEQVYYPKPGDPNPTARLGIAQPRGGETLWVDLSKYAGREFLIVRVAWAPDGRLIYQVQDREQRWLDLNEADPQTGKSRTLLHEASPAWVNVLSQPHWLNDGSFIWQSERDGWRHLYHYARDGSLLGRLTSGDWEVRRFQGVDQEDGWAYFSGTRDCHVESNAYRVRLDGSRLTRLTQPGSDHRVNFDPKFNYFFDTFSNITTPPKVHLRQSDGSLIRVASENKVAALQEYELATPRLLRVPTRDGYMMNAMLILPPDLDPNKKYPVLCYTYAGPHAPMVRNNWRRGRALDHMLATKGYIIWVCDNRSASGQGAVSAWQNYLRLGETELADLEDGLKWLIENHPYVDPERVGIRGHSYGGFQTSFALTHSTMFKVGVAGAPVTDWRLYDTIYTERYMRTPQNNPDGYNRTSVVKAAENLHGDLLILHGAMDNNVHVQNSLQLIHELQNAGKQFETMFYPKSRHGLRRDGHPAKVWLEFLYRKL